MNRSQKESVINELKDSFLNSEASFLVNYSGLTVAQMQDLRRKLTERGGKLKVFKARLMKIACSDKTDLAKTSLADESLREFSENFKEQVGLVFAQTDVPGVAKKIIEFSKNNKALGIVAGYFEKRMISKADIAILATIPPRDVLLAQVIRGIQGPVAGLVCVLNAVILKLLYVLTDLSVKEVANKKDS